jgi:branched-subunit amino acid transport protein AzlD
MPLQDAGSRVVRRVRAWPRRVLITIIVIAIVLVAARIALPFIVKNQVNHRLTSIPGYTGQVDAIGIGLLRGAYTLDGVVIFKVNGAAREPFFSARHIDFSLAWRELFHRKVVSEIYADDVELHLVAAATKEASQKDLDRRWQQVIKDLFPIDVTYFEVRNGLFEYRDMTKKPNVDLFIKHARILASGLRNRRDESGEEFPAKIHVEGDSLGGGRVQLAVQAEPLAAQPHFHLSAKIDDVNLPELNESLKGIAKVDVRRGTFRMVAEMAGKDGGFQGYVKPFFENVDFNNIEDTHKPVLTRIWENIVQGLAWLVKNKSRDQIGTRIPFEGRFGNPKLGLRTTIENLFRHGFIRAFNPTIEGSVKPENILPSGKSAKGPDIGAVKTDPLVTPKKETNKMEETKAEAATGRPTEKPAPK